MSSIQEKFNATIDLFRDQKCQSCNHEFGTVNGVAVSVDDVDIHVRVDKSDFENAKK